jgi:hypothetical protein
MLGSDQPLATASIHDCCTSRKCGHDFSFSVFGESNFGNLYRVSWGYVIDDAGRSEGSVVFNRCNKVVKQSEFEFYRDEMRLAASKLKCVCVWHGGAV